MPIRALDHIQIAIPVAGEPEAKRFYVDLLGFTERDKPKVLAGRGGCWFVAGSVQLHLGVEEDFIPAKKAHPAFLLDDLNGMVERLREAGCPIKEGPALPGYHRRFTADPFGNRIELMQKT